MRFILVLAIFICSGVFGQDVKSQENAYSSVLKELGHKVSLSDDFSKSEVIETLESRILRLLRNEYFARNGYVFQSKELSEYFNQFSWYLPNESSAEKVAAGFSNRAMANINYLKDLEQKKRVDQEDASKAESIEDEFFYSSRGNTQRIVFEGSEYTITKDFDDRHHKFTEGYLSEYSVEVYKDDTVHVRSLKGVCYNVRDLEFSVKNHLVYNFVTAECCGGYVYNTYYRLDTEKPFFTFLNNSYTTLRLEKSNYLWIGQAATGMGKEWEEVLKENGLLDRKEVNSHLYNYIETLVISDESKPVELIDVYINKQEAERLGLKKPFDAEISSLSIQNERLHDNNTYSFNLQYSFGEVNCVLEFKENKFLKGQGQKLLLFKTRR